MTYFGDIEINVEDLDAFVVFEIVQAPTMGEMTREGFVSGWEGRKYVLLAALFSLITDCVQKLRNGREAEGLHCKSQARAAHQY